MTRHLTRDLNVLSQNFKDEEFFYDLIFLQTMNSISALQQFQIISSRNIFRSTQHQANLVFFAFTEVLLNI